MTFATVKSNPYKKGLRPRRIHKLWPGRFWKRLCEQAKDDQSFRPRHATRWMSSECRRLIQEINEELYGGK
jgi:hypothetical protein